ncbi:DNA-binding CsgD family transcriptional regulator [Nocardiopsis mwathae]|uniref:DNA-binding CsgD family transcriptional regulator n=1 Tax=Nocardiopsis mwathae TaxID=1472723 RepID=A0A7W9YFY3_9ACTN|nr:helix-turn-helix transcriptional regulator [Nocardiopsis mwathae]MBB6171428.1 DNA-binding CsgD family transcriptional regulator [Nocardiopsis mwathae]
MQPRAARGDDLAEIRSALPRLRRDSGLPVVFGGAVGPGGRARYTELAGTRTEAIRGLVVEPGCGLGGKSLATRRPAWVRDYISASAISHEYDAAVRAEKLGAIVAVPVVVRDRPRGLLLGALRQTLPMGDRAIAAVHAVARAVEQEIAVRDEAQRRLLDLERARAGPRDRGTAAGAPHWEEIRALNAELRSLAGRVVDADLQARLLEISSRMASAADGDQAGRGRDGDAPALAPRELDVLSCAALGCTNAGIADQLGLRPETVKSYLRSAMRRLGAHTRLEAVSEARRQGLLP